MYKRQALLNFETTSSSPLSRFVMSCFQRGLSVSCWTDSSITVSYTHLDVYKRQTMTVWVLLSVRWDSSCPASARRTMPQRFSSLCLPTALPSLPCARLPRFGKQGTRTVSYTHLYRQSIAAHKLVEAPNGDLLWLSKENNSNGCINTVDLTSVVKDGRTHPD